VLHGLLTQRRQPEAAANRETYLCDAFSPRGRNASKTVHATGGAIRCTETETAVRCRVALDEGVEAVFEGAAPGYRLEKTAQADTSKTAGAGGGEAAEKAAAGAAGGVKRRGAAGRGDAVERLLEEVRRVFSGLPVYVGVEDGYVYVKRTAPMDKRQFERYLETCKRLGFRFDRRGERWVKPLEELKIA